MFDARVFRGLGDATLDNAQAALSNAMASGDPVAISRAQSALTYLAGATGQSEVGMSTTAKAGIGVALAAGLAWALGLFKKGR